MQTEEKDQYTKQDAVEISHRCKSDSYNPRPVKSVCLGVSKPKPQRDFVSDRHATDVAQHEPAYQANSSSSSPSMTTCVDPKRADRIPIPARVQPLIAVAETSANEQ